MDYLPLKNSACRLPDCPGVTDATGWCKVCDNVNFVPLLNEEHDKMFPEGHPVREIAENLFSPQGKA